MELSQKIKWYSHLILESKDFWAIQYCRVYLSLGFSIYDEWFMEINQDWNLSNINQLYDSNQENQNQRYLYRKK